MANSNENVALSIFGRICLTVLRSQLKLGVADSEGWALYALAMPHAILIGAVYVGAWALAREIFPSIPQEPNKILFAIILLSVTYLTVRMLFGSISVRRSLLQNYGEGPVPVTWIALTVAWYVLLLITAFVLIIFGPSS